MGCDGGSIPKRIELVKTKQKEAAPDKQVLQDTKWFHCMLSKELLRSPIVADFLGNLYNKEAVLRYLLNKGEFGDADLICGHVRSLKVSIPSACALRWRSAMVAAGSIWRSSLWKGPGFP
jgi:hypothetical protein